MLENLINILLTEKNLVLTLAFFTTVIIIYSVFVFYFYQFLAKKNIIEINLNQYNQYSNPTAAKFLAIIFYIIEYIILLPILTFFWFTVLAILILLLSKGIETETALLISAALVASVRATSYISEDLAKDLAKMIPFTMLAIAITTAGFFNINELLIRMTAIPSLFQNILYFLFFIVAVELIMRFADLTKTATQNNSEETATEEEA
ncbi:MAG: hypothetical protein KJ592_03235 [Nanoarchaeota archaeon]|nr:hypothetical protein [Nanoarchaeota archaeon]